MPQPNWTTWWNHSFYTRNSLALSTTIVFNSCNLVRVPRRLHSPCHSHRSRTAPRHQVPRPARSLHSALSSGFTRDVRTQTVPLCSVPSTHHATTADASTKLSILDFCSCVLQNTFRRTVPLRLHEDFREAQTAAAATSADATQLSLLQSKAVRKLVHISEAWER